MKHDCNNCTGCFNAGKDDEASSIYVCGITKMVYINTHLPGFRQFSITFKEVKSSLTKDLSKPNLPLKKFIICTNVWNKIIEIELAQLVPFKKVMVISVINKRFNYV